MKIIHVADKKSVFHEQPHAYTKTIKTEYLRNGIRFYTSGNKLKIQ